MTGLNFVSIQPIVVETGVKSFKTKYVVVLDEKRGDHQSQYEWPFGDYECLKKKKKNRGNAFNSWEIFQLTDIAFLNCAAVVKTENHVF